MNAQLSASFHRKDDMSGEDARDQFRELVIRELTEVIKANAVDRTTAHAVKVAEAIADRITCPDCGFIDIGLGNVGNRCNDCAPRHVASLP
jgi:hypothetical protein